MVTARGGAISASLKLSSGSTVGKSKSSREIGLEDEVKPQVDWGYVRKALAHWFASQNSDICLGILIFMNLVLVIWETDLEAAKLETPTWLVLCNNVLSGIYLVDLLCRIGVYRVRFFFHASSWLDIVVVGSDVIFLLIDKVFGSNGLPTMSMFRVFKLSRLARAVKVLVIFPELHLMIKGMKGAAMAIFWGCTLLCITLCCWGIVFVQLVNGLNIEVFEAGLYVGCERCPRAFSTVGQAMLTFTQQIIAGDSWGLVCVPIIERAPWTCPLFLGVLVSVGLAIMNLILAVIVDSAQEARKSSDHELARMKEGEALAARDLLYSQCQLLDTDASGTLTIEELWVGFDTNEEFRDALSVMDIRKEDITLLFSILDEDQSGDVDYDEFIKQLHKMKSHDEHTLLVFVKYHVEAIHNKVMEAMETIHARLAEPHDQIATSLMSESAICVPGAVDLGLSKADLLAPATLYNGSDGDCSTITPPIAAGFTTGTSIELAQVNLATFTSCAPDPEPQPDSKAYLESASCARDVLIQRLEAARLVFEEGMLALRCDEASAMQPPRRATAKPGSESIDMQLPTEPRELDGDLPAIPGVRHAYFGKGVQRLGLELLWHTSPPSVGVVETGSEASRQGVVPGDVVAECNGRWLASRQRHEILDILGERPLTLGVTSFPGVAISSASYYAFSSNAS